MVLNDSKGIWRTLYGFRRIYNATDLDRLIHPLFSLKSVKKIDNKICKILWLKNYSILFSRQIINRLFLLPLIFDLTCSSSKEKKIIVNRETRDERLERIRIHVFHIFHEIHLKQRKSQNVTNICFYIIYLLTGKILRKRHLLLWKAFLILQLPEVNTPGGGTIEST